MRPLDEAIFDRAFAAMASENRWQETPDYYPRYRSRYRAIRQRLAGEASSQPIDVPDIGGVLEHFGRALSLGARSSGIRGLPGGARAVHSCSRGPIRPGARQGWGAVAPSPSLPRQLARVRSGTRPAGALRGMAG
jgi:hypothetical protein